VATCSQKLPDAPTPIVARTIAAAGSTRTRNLGIRVQSTLSNAAPTAIDPSPGPTVAHDASTTAELEADSTPAAPHTIHSGGRSRPDIAKSCEGRPASEGFSAASLFPVRSTGTSIGSSVPDMTSVEWHFLGASLRQVSSAEVSSNL
jgi:hypothetical protein